MEEQLKNLYQEIVSLLSMVPCLDDCTDQENEILSDIANLYNSLYDAGYSN